MKNDGSHQFQCIVKSAGAGVLLVSDLLILNLLGGDELLLLTSIYLMHRDGPKKQTTKESFSCIGLYIFDQTFNLNSLAHSHKTEFKVQASHPAQSSS